MNVASMAPGPSTGTAWFARTCTLVGQDGKRLRGTPVSVEQVRHASSSATSASTSSPWPTARPNPPAQPRSAGRRRTSCPASSSLWFDLFNTVTLPFYWRDFEPEPGNPDTTRLLRAARWFGDRGCTVKGHPLVWHTHGAALAPRPPIRRGGGRVRARITREVTGFADVISTWDAINEAVIMPVFEKEANAITPLAQQLGRVGMVRLAFETARAANPGATLILNDFDMSVDYERLIEACLEAGISINGIGLQSHMHQGYWGETKTLEYSSGSRASGFRCT